MITFSDAKKMVTQAIAIGETETIPLKEAPGRVLAQEIASPIDSPPFDSSAMDGYAIQATDQLETLNVVDVVSAGEVPKREVKPGEAIRIMTGAIIPPGATAVIAQENVIRKDDQIETQTPVPPQLHIRHRGEELKKGDCALKSGSVLKPGALGFLASLGVKEVTVIKSPKVAILPTGSELITPDQPLTPGKIYESNSVALGAACEELSLTPTLYPPSMDTLEETLPQLKEALENNDIVILTGGISVGDFDVVKEALAQLDVKTIFWKVAQKPGKPLYFGQRESTFVFGLPGNPAASLVCFYEFVRTALLKKMGHQECDLMEETAQLSAPIKKKGERTHLIRAVANRNQDGLWVQPAGGQGSHLMQSFAASNCLIVAPQDSSEFQKGETINIHWLPERNKGVTS